MAAKRNYATSENKISYKKCGGFLFSLLFLKLNSHHCNYPMSKAFSPWL
jgi:hypothetical protein